MWNTFGTVKFSSQFGTELEPSYIPFLLPSSFPFFPRLLPRIMAEALRRSLGAYFLLALLGLSFTEPVVSLTLNTRLLGTVDSLMPTAKRKHWCQGNYSLHRAEWTERDRVMNSFVSSHNLIIFICKELIMTHQVLSSLTTSPYLKFPLFLFFTPFSIKIMRYLSISQSRKPGMNFNENHCQLLSSSSKHKLV